MNKTPKNVYLALLSSFLEIVKYLFRDSYLKSIFVNHQVVGG